MCQLCERVDFLYETVKSLCSDDEARKLMIESLSDPEQQKQVAEADPATISVNVLAHLVSVWLVRERIHVVGFIPLLVNHFRDELGAELQGAKHPKPTGYES